MTVCCRLLREHTGEYCLNMHVYSKSEDILRMVSWTQLYCWPNHFKGHPPPKCDDVIEESHSYGTPIYETAHEGVIKACIDELFQGHPGTRPSEK